MYNAIKPKNPNHPSIDALGLLGPRAMIVIERNKSIIGIAAYKQTLGPKVGRFKEVRSELIKLVSTYRQLALDSGAEIEALDDVTRVWAANVQRGTPLDPDDIGIIDSRAPEAVLDNAQKVIEMLLEHGELPLAVEAVNEIETKHESAKTAYEEAQEGRVAVQVKQQELRTIAEGVHDELVKLRKVARIALGSSHIDYQRLRVRNTRAAGEVPDESTSETEGAAKSDRTSGPSSG